MSDPIRIALIDDDEAIRESIGDVLTSEGYSVALYANGKEALEGLAKTEPPNVIICDLVMPVMNGWQFLEAQSASRGERGRVPVLVLSATPDYGTLQHENVCEVVQKPFNIDSLMYFVEKLSTHSEAS
jgi:CheY-like chemotaxis protein